MVLSQHINRISPLVRATLVIGTVAALVTGVTFAALQDTATLTNNTINSDFEGLLVDSDGDDSFNQTDQGFAFNDIEPGEDSSFKSFSLRNDTDESIDVFVQVTGEEPLPSGVDPNDIVFIFDIPDGGDVSADWGEIIQTDGVKLLDNFDAGDTADIKVKVELDSDVPDDISITPFNFTFGTLEE